MAHHKVLLLGLGFWGERWIQALQAHPHCEVVGISAGPASVSRFAQAHGIDPARGWTDYRKAIERAEADVVIISLPTALHLDASIHALEKGMHVICEKPLAASREEADAIVACHQRHPSRQFMVSQNYRWRPHNQCLRNAVAAGLIGEVGSVRLEFRQPECFIGYREFLPYPLLQDVCIHHFDLIRFLTGRECERILAHVSRPAWSQYKGVPSTDALLFMEKGAIGNYHGTWAARGRETSWDGDISLTGEKGCLTLAATGEVRFYAAGDNQGTVLPPPSMAQTELNHALASFLQCVENDTPPETSLEDNYRSFSIVCAAEESARTGKIVSL